MEYTVILRNGRYALIEMKEQYVVACEFDETQPKECHKVITDYFRSLIPADKKYYLH